jgi:hypothetical protein
MQGQSKETRGRRKWETPALTVLSFPDTRNIVHTAGDLLLTGLYS